MELHTLRPVNRQQVNSVFARLAFDCLEVGIEFEFVVVGDRGDAVVVEQVGEADNALVEMVSYVGRYNGDLVEFDALSS